MQTQLSHQSADSDFNYLFLVFLCVTSAVCLADANGGGKADILGIYDDKVVTRTSTGSGFAAEQVSRDATVLNFNPDKERRLIGDVTGDGREDIVMIKANGVYVLVANDNGGYEK